MKKTLLAIALMVGFTPLANAMFYTAKDCNTTVATINPLGQGKITGYKFADLNWSALTGTKTEWSATYLGKSASFTNTFTFGTGGNSIFSTATSVAGDTAKFTTFDSLFSFLFTTPVGSVSSEGFQSKNKPNYFVSLSADKMTATLWLDDTGAGNDRDYNDMGIRLHATTSPVPIPTAAWLFGSALLGLGGVARKKTNIE